MHLLTCRARNSNIQLLILYHKLKEKHRNDTFSLYIRRETEIWCLGLESDWSRLWCPPIVCISGQNTVSAGLWDWWLCTRRRISWISCYFKNVVVPPNRDLCSCAGDAHTGSTNRMRRNLLLTRQARSLYILISVPWLAWPIWCLRSCHSPMLLLSYCH